MASDDLTGHVLAGEYRLLRLIREGMGAVYEARALSTGERVAVKVLSDPELAGDAEVLGRFVREAQATALVQSEHVVRVIHSGVDEASRTYHVMEYLLGEDLQDTLDRVQRLNQVVTIKLAYQAAAGLAVAHELGIVHRDVKPSNLFLVRGADDEVKVKVLDFGVAKVKMQLLSETLSSLTRSGSLLGTPFYMAPEQVKRASSIEATADVWSLGIVLYECLTGELPWGEADSYGELIAAVLTLEIKDVREIAPWVRPELALIVRRALARDVKQRPATAAELRDSLGALLPEGARSTWQELAAPTESERNTSPGRISYADTLMSPLPVELGVPPASDRDRTRRRRSRGFAIAAVGGLVLGAYAFVSKALSPPLPPAPQSPHSAVPLSAAEPAPRSLEPLRFLLEVAPAGVAVAVDGTATSIVDGKVPIEGNPNTTRSIALSLAGRTLEVPILITEDGIRPARVAIPLSPPRPEREAKSHPLGPKVAVSSTPIVEPPSLGPDAGLSREFE